MWSGLGRQVESHWDTSKGCSPWTSCNQTFGLGNRSKWLRWTFWETFKISVWLRFSHEHHSALAQANQACMSSDSISSCYLSSGPLVEVDGSCCILCYLNSSRLLLMPVADGHLLMDFSGLCSPLFYPLLFKLVKSGSKSQLNVGVTARGWDGPWVVGGKFFISPVLVCICQWSAEVNTAYVLCTSWSFTCSLSYPVLSYISDVTQKKLIWLAVASTPHGSL